MANKEKWVDLFEQVVGRRPTPAEFLAGKNSQFDLKQIRAIAGQNQQLPLDPNVQRTNKQPLSGMQSAPQTTAPVPTPVKRPLTTGQKIRRGLLGVGAVVGLGLAGVYYYFSQQTGPEVAVEQFTLALASNDYDQLAQLLSTETETWNKEETKGFLDYLKTQAIDLEEELEKLAEQQTSFIYRDERGNQLFGLEESSKLFGIFPEYQVKTYPVDLSLMTNLDEVKVNNQVIEKNKKTSLGKVKFAPEQLAITATTDLGKLDTTISLDLENIEDNQALIELKTSSKKITAKLPDELIDIEKTRLTINGKTVGDGLSQELDLLDHQEIEVSASFSYDNKDYSSEPTVVNTGNKAEITLQLNLSDEDWTTIKAIQKEKENKRQQEAEAKDKLEKNKALYAQSLQLIANDSTNGAASHYAFFDVDGNGTVELITARGDRDKLTFAAIYYLKNGTSTYLAQTFAESSEDKRDYFTIYTDGSIEHDTWLASTGRGTAYLYRLAENNSGQSTIAEKAFNLGGTGQGASLQFSDGRSILNVNDLTWNAF